MTNNELSEIEIKLINASRKFIEEQNKKIERFRYHLEMVEDPTREKSWICINFPYEWNSLESIFRGFKSVRKQEYRAIVSINYEGNATNGPINIGRLKNEEYIVNFQNIYRNFLIKEIPEIKERIK